ncbi:MAG: hypothetical protein IPP19_06120 [Verrucomicrobia bacterium]|nr:hypothetical protein [Verrucomicrobiota bacterium]
MQKEITAGEALKIFNKHAEDPEFFERILHFQSDRQAFGTSLFFGALPLIQFFQYGFTEFGPLRGPSADGKNYSIAQLDEYNRPIVFSSFNDEGVCRYGGVIHYFGEGSWISIEGDLELRKICGGAGVFSMHAKHPGRAFTFYRADKAVDEYNYIFNQNLCERIAVNRYQGSPLKLESEFEYIFKYDKFKTVSRVTIDGSRSVYQSPKNFDIETSLKQVESKLTKELATFLVKKFRSPDFSGIGIFYDGSSKFSSISVGATTHSLKDSIHLSEDEIRTAFDLQEEEFDELEDFETSSSPLEKHLRYLESNWKPTTQEFDSVMNRFCSETLKHVRKKAPKITYIYASERECGNLINNIRLLAKMQ